MVVVTRSRALEQQKEEVRHQEQEQECGVVSKSIEVLDGIREDHHEQDPDPKDRGDEQDLPFCEFDELFSPAGKSRTHLSRSQKRAARLRVAQEKERPRHKLDCKPDELRKMQEEDDSLKEAWEAARGKSKAAGPGFFIRDGLLYRKAGNRDQLEQLAVPAPCRQDVLRLAHEIPTPCWTFREK